MFFVMEMMEVVTWLPYMITFPHPLLFVMACCMYSQGSVFDPHEISLDPYSAFTWRVPINGMNDKSIYDRNWTYEHLTLGTGVIWG